MKNFQTFNHRYRKIRKDGEIVKLKLLLRFFAFLFTCLNGVLFAPFLFPLTFLPARKPIIDHFTTLLPIVVFLLFVNSRTAYYRYYCCHFSQLLQQKGSSTFEKEEKPYFLGKLHDMRNFEIGRFSFLKEGSILQKFPYFYFAATLTRSFDLLST